MSSETSGPAATGAVYRGPALFGGGFRPFFLAAPIYTSCVALVWLAYYFGWVDVELDVPGFVWHAHEMLLGFSVAVLAGFFLTAVPSWTDSPSLRGRPLAVLFAIWLLGRIAMWLSMVLPAWLVAVVDLSFLAALVLFLAPALASAKTHNLAFIPLLGLLMGANFLFHLDALGLLQGSGVRGLYLGIDTLALIIAMIGGRVIPSFTASAFEAAGRRSPILPTPRLNRFALGSLTLLVAVDLILPGTSVAGVVALGAAGLHLWRLTYWRGYLTLGQPIVWVLHLAYLWLVVGLALRGLSGIADVISPSLATHVIVIGAFGSMTMGFMTRASLGHTGRERVAPPVAVAGYALISLACLVRLVLPLIDPSRYDVSVAAAGLCWALGFGLVSLMLWPILTRPRPDGEPG
jgi:uncharacterized protein involved in response to NO